MRDPQSDAARSSGGQSLEDLTGQVLFDHYQAKHPRLVSAIRDLLALGVSPAQIEKQCTRRYGPHTPTVTDIRVLADYMAGDKS